MEVRIWEKENVCLALGTDFKVAGRLVSENWPPILTRSKIWSNNSEGEGHRREELEEWTQEDEGWEGVSIFRWTDGLRENVNTGTTRVGEGRKKAKRISMVIALNIGGEGKQVKCMRSVGSLY